MRTAQASDAVGTALAAAGISPERCGRKRSERLNERERRLYRWVLTEFAQRGRPDGATFRAKTAELELDATTAVEALAHEDLIHLDGEGEVAVAYPFSASPTRHRVRLSEGNEVFAMCALDALGMAAMLDRAIEVRSTDPASGEPIVARVGTDGRAEWKPQQAVVLAGARGDGPSYQGCCAVLNFFASPASAERYLREQPDVRGHVMSVPAAAAAGAAIFGDALAG
jgi:hypothetical protein